MRLRLLAPILALALAGSACSASGEDVDKTMDWACINWVGWLIGTQEGYDVSSLEKSAQEMYFHAQDREADGENWEVTEDVAGDLLGWYMDDNAMDVDAFVELNDCIDRTG